MKRRGFTLVELLVVVSIIMVLMGLIAAAVSAARGSQKKQATQALIAKLDAIIAQQYATYNSRTITSATSSAMRASALRQIASGDMPDSWEDIRILGSGTTVFISGTFPISSSQKAYHSIWNELPADSKDASKATYVGKTNGDAECLFMIVMQGGIADCIDCGELKTSDKGDTDSDGAFEFLDAWGNPIRFILWPAQLQLPAGSTGSFFSASPPFLSGVSGRLMRPLIFSSGPDGSSAGNQNPSLVTNSAGNLGMGTSCGNPSSITFASVNPNRAESPADNLTNFDVEASQ
jgi:type II secretory pathway pseudopilin PulG